MTKMGRVRTSLVLFFLVSFLGVVPAYADLWVASLDAPAVVQNPVGGFNVTYSLGGSSYSGSALVRFYLSSTPNGSSGVTLLTSYTETLSGSGPGLRYPSGYKTIYMHPINLQPSGQAALQSLAESCQPQTVYVLAQVDWSNYRSRQGTFGTMKLPDFAFASGALSPSTIQPGGSANLSFAVTTRCPAPTVSRVGIYLTDTAFSPLSFLGSVTLAAGSGTWNVSPTPITFSPAMPIGDYRILLLADVDQWVTESNENNNAGWFSLLVRLPLVGAAQATRGELAATSSLPSKAIEESLALVPEISEDYVLGVAPLVLRKSPAQSDDSRQKPAE